MNMTTGVQGNGTGLQDAKNDSRTSGSMSSMTLCARGHSVFLASLILLVAFLAFSIGPMSAQTGGDDGPLQPKPDTTLRRPITNDAVLRMTKAGLDDAIILQTIDAQPGHYEVGADALIALKQGGVSERVIAAMQAKAAGLAVRPADKPGPGVVPGALAPALDEIGVYYKDKSGDWVPLKTEKVVFKSSGWLKNTVSYGIVKQDMNGHLEGEKSPLALATGVQLLIFAPPGTDAAEYDFLRLQQKKNAREFRTLTGGVFHSESGTARNELDFHPEKIAPRMYTFTVPQDIQKGEYGVLPPGASNQRGFADTGKIFTFSIAE